MPLVSQIRNFASCNLRQLPGRQAAWTASPSTSHCLISMAWRLPTDCDCHKVWHFSTRLDTVGVAMPAHAGSPPPRNLLRHFFTCIFLPTPLHLRNPVPSGRLPWFLEAVSLSFSCGRICGQLVLESGHSVAFLSWALFFFWKKKRKKKKKVPLERPSTDAGHPSVDIPISKVAAQPATESRGAAIGPSLLTAALLLLLTLVF